MFIDVHTHLNDEKYSEDLGEVIARLKSDGVIVVNSGYDLKSSERARELAEQNENMYFTVGVHPDDAKTVDKRAIEILKSLAEDKKCVGIGETGFDFYWNKSGETEQENAFLMQIELANELNKPFIVHSRDASLKTLEFLTKHRNLINCGFLMHCYQGSGEMAKSFSDLGGYFSFGGVITFKNAKKDDVIKSIDRSRILTETDSPYLTPEPFRGRRNEPSFVKYVVKKIAEIWEVETAVAEGVLYENARRFYKI